MSWTEVSYILGSKTRKAVLGGLETPKTPTLLAQELHTSIPNISRALRELQSKGLVECLTPEARVGKIFVATKKGRTVLSRVKRMQETETKAKGE